MEGRESPLSHLLVKVIMLNSKLVWHQQIENIKGGNYILFCIKTGSSSSLLT